MSDATKSAKEEALLLQTECEIAALHAILRTRFDLDSMGSAWHPMTAIAEALDKLRWEVYKERIK